MPADADAGALLAVSLLAHLRAALAEPALDFAEPPRALKGGFDTRIFAFRLSGGPPGFTGPLILRLLAPHHDPTRVLRERATQNTVAALGYPAPRVLLASTDTAALGGAWLVMERVAGHSLLQGPVLAVRRILVEMQWRLHALDVDPLLNAWDEEGRATAVAGRPTMSGRMITLDGVLAQFEARVVGRSLDGLRPAMRWLIARRPAERRRVICHGDFHPENILVSDGAVTGVLDWPNVVVADPECDVAATRTILGLAPIELLGLTGPVRWLMRGLRPLLVNRYLADYRRRYPVDATRLAYFEALACMRGLIRAAESRTRAGTAGADNVLDASSLPAALATRFARLTGIVPSVTPPAAASV